MRAFVINLDRAVARMEAFDAQATRIGLAYERVSAVDGARITQTSENMRPAQTACFASHRAVWQRLVDQNENWGVVFEDDVCLSTNIVSLLADENWTRYRAAVIKLETVSHRIKLKRRGHVVGSRWKLHDLLTYHHGTGGYIIDRDGAQKLLAVTEAMDRPVDDVLFDLVAARSLGLSVLQLIPAVCVQDRVLAEIEGRPVLHESHMQIELSMPPPTQASLSARLVREISRTGRNVRRFIFGLPRGTAFPLVVKVPYEP